MDVLNRVLKDALVGVSGGWEEDDYCHEDLVIEEYSKAPIGPCTHFTVEWKFRDKARANYFLYYTIPKHGRDEHNKDSGGPQPPSLVGLESMEKAPLNYHHQNLDYYYHHCVGQVIKAFFVTS